MSSCNDYWCEYYGKGGEQCDRCEKKGVENELSQLQVLLNWQVNRDLEELGEKGEHKSIEQER
jgi:hypothetical protein